MIWGLLTAVAFGFHMSGGSPAMAAYSFTAMVTIFTVELLT